MTEIITNDIVIEWMCLWNGSLSNTSSAVSSGQRHWWCDWVHRLGIYGYDPIKVFPWPRNKAQWLHDTGWSHPPPHATKVLWLESKYLERENEIP